MTKMHPKISEVTDRIIERSKETRAAYLRNVDANRRDGARRVRLTEGNVAHATAGCPVHDKTQMFGSTWPNLGIVTAYNDMLSAHQPFERFPDLIKWAARKVGATAQVAGGTPAMCDGVTQGQPGMEASLLSRDIIAMGTNVALSHDMFDAAIYLGVCDKIVPGLLIGALRAGWLPAIFAPAGPMPSGLPNKEKARIRQLFAEGKVGREKLLEAESQSYHSPGTCTFYGTANSNQMLMEIMGLQLPGSSFVHPNTPLRDSLTAATTRRAAAITALGDEYTPIADVVDERALVNGLVGLMATGGSTNLTIHIIAIARAAGISLNWDDFSDISAVTPLLCRIYPNGYADVNHFHAAGGMAFLIRELLNADLLHGDVNTVAGEGGLHRYTEEAQRHRPEDHREADIKWVPGPKESGDPDVLREATKPFSPDGGVRVLQGNLGRAVIKTSAVAKEHRIVKAPAIVFEHQNDLMTAFQEGELERDFIAVVRFQGPRANGMPELHKLTPVLGALQDKGFKVALVTDGRMSGASGKVPAAIHLSPEAFAGGIIARIETGDILTLNGETGVLDIENIDAVLARPLAQFQPAAHTELGLDMYAPLRAIAGAAEEGASILGNAEFTEHGKDHA